MSRRTATEDLRGVPPGMYRTALYAEDEEGRRIGPGGERTMRVRAGLEGTYTTAHAGSVGDVRVDERQNVYRAAQLTQAQIDVVLLRERGDTLAEIAVTLRITIASVKCRLQRAQRRIADLDEATRRL